MKKLTVLVLAVFLFSACSKPSVAPPTDAEKETIKREINTMMDGLWKAANALDADKVLSYGDTTDTDFRFVTVRADIQDYHEFKNYLTNSYSNLSAQNIAESSRLINILNHDCAVVVTDNQASYTPKEGRPYTLPMSYSIVVCKEKNKWTVASVHQSSNLRKMVIDSSAAE